MRPARNILTLLLLAAIQTVPLLGEEFNYFPPGDLIPGTGTGLNDCSTHSPSPLLFPIRKLPAFPKSQVYNSPAGLCLPPEKYDHPWRDNFCECRSWAASLTPECPAQGNNCSSGEDGHHQGVDILPPTCTNSFYDVVAVASGNLQRVNSYIVDLIPDNAPEITYRYLHMSNVIADQHVVRGDPIGKVSNVFTAATTVHLHFEILVNGRHVSPYMTLLEAYRQTIGRIAPGARIRATKALTVHSGAAGNIIGSKAAGSTGIVLGNTQQANYQGNCWIWKQIQWDDGLIGYSQDNYLAVVSPTSLVQVKYTGTLMPVGSVNDAAVVTLGGHVTSPVGKDVALEVELRRLDEFGGLFTGSKTHESALRPSGTTTSVCVAGLVDGAYHWRARVRDESGGVTPWQSFGGNSDSEADFSVQANPTSCVACAPWPSESGNQTLISKCGPGAQVPSVSTTAATSVTQASASLNMSVDPNGAATNIYFNYGPTTSMTLVTNSQGVGAGNTPIPASIPVTGLSCNTTYYYRARASNSAGDAAPGSMLSFTTSTCGGGGSQTRQLVNDPSFEAGPNAWWVASPAFYIDGKPIFLNPRTGNNYAFLSNSDGSRGNNLTGGMISPSVTIPSNATDLDLRFWYSITSDETTTSQVFDKLEAYLVRPGNQLTLITTLSNLNENGTSYSLRSTDISSSFYGDTVQIFFRGTTDSSLPTVFRIDDVTLEAVVPLGGPPSVSTLPADQIAAASARLNMTVNPNGSDTAVWFDLDPNDSTPSTDTVHFSIGSGTQNQTVSWTAYGLTCGTTYYFRAHAGNAFDPDESGSVLSFTTTACSGGSPRADTEAATNITRDAATLNARPDANGLEAQAWFAWGESNSLGLETPRQPIGSAVGKVNFSYQLTGLACGRTYYFENHVANAADEDDGATLSFTTDSCEPAGPPIVTVTASAATATENPLTSGVLLIQRTGSTAGDLVVTYSVGGTATVGVDHTLAGGSVTIPAGSASSILTVFPLDDFLVESDETVVVTLQAQAQYQVGEPSSATVVIVSDDVPSGAGGCGRILVQQPRDQFGGCDTSDTGTQWRMAENFRLADRRNVSCLEVLGYYWPDNDPPQSSVFDVVFYEVASSGVPGAVIHEDRGVHVLRQKTGQTLAGMEEWRFALELTTPVELAAGSYFVEVAGAAGTGGSFCWSGGQIDPIAGVNGLAFSNTGQWSVGDWNLAFKVFEAGIFVDGFESGTTENWSSRWP